MNSYKAHNKTLVHHCNIVNKSIQIIMDCAAVITTIRQQVYRLSKVVKGHLT